MKEASACIVERPCMPVNPFVPRWLSRIVPSSFAVQSMTHEGNVLPDGFWDATAKVKIRRLSWNSMILLVVWIKTYSRD